MSPYKKGEIMIWDVIIIGAGASGLFAACQFQDRNILVLEKNKEVGMKLNITGSGQCNLTHGGKIYDFKSHYNNWKFIKDTLKAYDNQALINFFHRRGLATFENEQHKVFPKSLKAEDVTHTLLKTLLKQGVKLNTNESVLKIEKEEYYTLGTSKASYQAKHIIVATGGMTYQNTGSEGDGYRLARMLSVPVIEPRFALAQVYGDLALTPLSGISFNATITHRNQKYYGDLLITHHGFSGPVILNNSRYFRKDDLLKINFLNESSQEFDHMLLKQIEMNPKKSIKQVLYTLTTKRLVDYMLQSLDIDSQTIVSELSKKKRQSIVNYLCDFSLVIKKVGKAHISMVTAGGIATEALNKKTFEVKEQKGLYFIGECVDIDGDTGGYNLQYAFSSAVAATKDINRKLER